MKAATEEGKLIVYPEGRIDATNAPTFEKELTDLVAAHPGAEPVLDAGGLQYISSAGLRVLLRLRKSEGKKLLVRNVSPELYEIFEITGFTSLLRVEKALRFVSAEGLEVLGGGVHSTVYRLDDESILKVVYDMTLDAIREEMQVSKTALIHGIPTAISYDVVRSEEGYGEIYEMFRAGVLSAAVMAEPERREEYLRRFAAMYREIHSSDVSDTELGSIKARYMDAVGELAAYITPEERALLEKLLGAIPERHTFVHGDFHMNNVMLQDGELLLIDVGEAGYGHPLFDFAQTAWAYYTATEYAPERCGRITGMTMEEARYVCGNVFPFYFGKPADELEGKLTVIHGMALLRMILLRFLQGLKEQPDFQKRLDLARAELFPRVDELCGLIRSEFPE